MRFVAVAVVLFLAACAAHEPAGVRDADRIVGTWKLVSVVYEDAVSKERTPVLGEHPKGRQIATADGRWLALVTADGRKVPQTDAERAQALRTMIAYTGRYRVEDGKVITRVEAAWNEAWVGGDQVRFVRFEGDRLLHIESPPMPHPNVNGRVVRVIVTWERDL
jgi:lipocalin-like protein